MILTQPSSFKQRSPGPSLAPLDRDPFLRLRSQDLNTSPQTQGREPSPPPLDLGAWAPALLQTLKSRFLLSALTLGVISPSLLFSNPGGLRELYPRV